MESYSLYNSGSLVLDDSALGNIIYYFHFLPGYGSMLSEKEIQLLMPLVAMVMILWQCSKWLLMGQAEVLFMEWMFKKML